MRAEVPGWECRTFLDGVFYYGHRFPTHEGAVAEAEHRRRELEAAGWVADEPATSG